MKIRLFLIIFAILVLPNFSFGQVARLVYFKYTNGKFSTPKTSESKKYDWYSLGWHNLPVETPHADGSFPSLEEDYRAYQMILSLAFDKTDAIIAASFYNEKEFNDVVYFKNNLSPKAKIFVPLDDSDYEALAQVRCLDYCKGIALAITFRSKSTKRILGQEDFILARTN